MSKCLLLLKIKLLGFFNPQTLRHGGTKAKSRLILVAAVALVCIVMVISTNVSTAVMFSKLGMSDVLPSFMLAVCSFVVLILSFMTNNSVLFGFKDYDMVMSMPVTNAAVITSRLLTGYMINVLFSVVSLAPAMVIFSIKTHPSVSVWFMMIVSVFLVPVLPMIIAAVFGVIIQVFTIRMRKSNILNIILSTIATIAFLIVFYGSFFSLYAQGLSQLGSAMDKAVSTFYPPAIFFRSMLLDASWYSFGIFVILSLVPAALFLFCLSLFYVKINSAMSGRRVQSNYKMEKLKASSPFRALYAKEMRRLITSTIYCLNSLIGVILLLVGSLAIVIINPGVIGEALGVQNYVALMRSAAPLLMCLLLALNTTTSTSLSLEGKERWIPFSMPVGIRTIYNAKIALNLTISIPIVLVSGILLTISFGYSPLEIIALFITPILFTCFMSVLGMYFNIKFPKYDWTTEQQAVKQGLSLVVTMGVGIIAALIPFGLTLSYSDSALLIAAVTSLAALLGAAILYNRIQKLDVSI